MKKRDYFLILVFLSFFLINIVSAELINLSFSYEPVQEAYILELNQPALFDLTIKNLGPSDSFEIYSLVGVDFSPKGTFQITQGASKKIRLEVRPLDSLKRSRGYVNFVYKIKGSNTGVQEDTMTIKILEFKDAFSLTADPISPESDKTLVTLRNKEKVDFGEIEAEFSSAFFKYEEIFPLSSLESKSFEITIDKEKLKTLIAGPYILAANLKAKDIETKVEGTIKFLEKEGISSQETKEGFLSRRHEIEKINEGNTAEVVQITISKTFFSRIFTNFNIPSTKSDTKGITTTYVWQKELRPGESIKVIAKTNWFIPILLVIIIVAFVFFYRQYLISDLTLTKKITPVKTKGGEFALKITVFVKARKFVEKINIVDRLPPMVKLFERFGAITPDRIDEKNRRIEWNIGSLNEYEERVLSYIIYSKIGVVGTFGLPPVRAIYERDGKVREAESNKTFFVNNPKVKKDKY